MVTRLSMRDAIDAKCKDCIYDPFAPGTWRAQVAECPSANCALHPLRPRPIVQKRTEDAPQEQEPPNTAESAADASGASFFGLPGYETDQ